VRITHDDGTYYSQKVDTQEYLHQVWIKNNSILSANSAEFGMLTPLELTLWKLSRDIGTVKAMVENGVEAVRGQLLEAIGNADTVDRLIQNHNDFHKPPAP